MIEVILFDLDDTLYDYQEFVISGFSALATHLEDNYQINKEKALRRLLKENSFDGLLKSCGLYKGSAIIELINVYREHIPQIKLYPWVAPILSVLPHKTGIVTNGLPLIQRNKINALKLHQMVDHIIYAGEWGEAYYKPHPLPFLLALEHFQVLPEHTLFIGNDPVADIQGAKNVGITVFNCRRSTRRDYRE